MKCLLFIIFLLLIPLCELWNVRITTIMWLKFCIWYTHHYVEETFLHRVLVNLKRITETSKFFCFFSSTVIKDICHQRLPSWTYPYCRPLQYANIYIHIFQNQEKLCSPYADDKFQDNPQKRCTLYNRRYLKPNIYRFNLIPVSEFLLKRI